MKPLKGVVFDRAKCAGNPLAKQIPGVIVWDVCAALDETMRAHGVSSIVWEIRDNGVLLEVVPFFPADCAAEAAAAMEVWGAVLKAQGRQ